METWTSMATILKNMENLSILLKLSGHDHDFMKFFWLQVYHRIGNIALENNEFKPSVTCYAMK